MVQLLQDLADEFADFAQGMVRGNPLLRMNVRKHPALILRPSAHLQSSRRIRGGLNHHSFALARFFSKLLEAEPTAAAPSILQDSVRCSAPTIFFGLILKRLAQSISERPERSAMQSTLQRAPSY